MNSPATKELFASTPRYLMNASNIAAGSAAGGFANAGGGGGGGGSSGGSSGSGGSQYKKRRRQHVHKSILSKGLLPLDHSNNNDNVDARTGHNDEKFSVLEDSLLLPASRYETAEKNSTEKNSTERKTANGHKEIEIGRSEWMSEAAATAANTAAQISHSIHSAITTITTTNNNSNNNKVTYPHQMAELHII